MDHKVYALQGSAGLASSPWPKFHCNPQTTGRFGFAPAISRQPSHVVFSEGATGRIAVDVTGVPAPSLQWFFGGLPIPGQTQSVFSIPAATRAAEGSYTLVASNGTGKVTSTIPAVVSNVDPQSFVGLQWDNVTGGAVSLGVPERAYRTTVAP